MATRSAKARLRWTCRPCWVAVALLCTLVLCSAWHAHRPSWVGGRRTSLAATVPSRRKSGGGRGGGPRSPSSFSFIHRGKVTDTDPLQLLDFVCSTFPDVKRTAAKQWLKYNSIVVNEEPQAQHDFPLRVGDWVAVRKSTGGSSGSGGGGGGGGGGLAAAGLRLLHADDALFVVDKPAGMPLAAAPIPAPTPAGAGTRKDTGGRGAPPRSAHSYVAAHVKRRHGDAAKVRLWPAWMLLPDTAFFFDLYVRLLIRPPGNTLHCLFPGTLASFFDLYVPFTSTHITLPYRPTTTQPRRFLRSAWTMGRPGWQSSRAPPKHGHMCRWGYVLRAPLGVSLGTCVCLYAPVCVHLTVTSRHAHLM